MNCAAQSATIKAVLSVSYNDKKNRVEWWLSSILKQSVINKGWPDCFLRCDNKFMSMKRMICPYKMCPRKRRTMLFLCRLCLKSIKALQWYLAPQPHPLSQSSSVHVCNLSNLSHTMFFLICDKQHVSPPGHSERFNDGRESQEDKNYREREGEREGKESKKEREDVRPLWLQFCCSAEAYAPSALSGWSHTASIFRSTPLTVAAEARTQCWRDRNIGY